MFKGLNVGMLDIKILLISCMVFQNLSLWISSKYLFYYKEFVSQKNNFNAQSLNKCALYTSLFKANIVEAKFKFKSKLKTQTIAINIQKSSLKKWICFIRCSHTCTNTYYDLLQNITWSKQFHICIRWKACIINLECWGLFDINKYHGSKTKCLKTIIISATHLKECKQTLRNCGIFWGTP